MILPINPCKSQEIDTHSFNSYSNSSASLFNYLMKKSIHEVNWDKQKQQNDPLQLERHTLLSCLSNSPKAPYQKPYLFILNTRHRARKCTI